jgi:hypothetical protein
VKVHNQLGPSPAFLSVRGGSWGLLPGAQFLDPPLTRVFKRRDSILSLKGDLPLQKCSIRHWNATLRQDRKSRLQETLQPLLNLSFNRSSIQGGSGDNGAGLGANHQTGWTGLVAKMIDPFGRPDPGTFLEGGARIAFRRPEPSGRGDMETRLGKS